ncbi:hypothetical protein NMG60_11023749 [Bertholletia excelsa]
MAVFMSTKLKRKELEDVNDEFSDFSLSSPARKIRRLDAELPPIIEEDRDGPWVFEQPMAPEENFASNTVQLGESGLVIEELPDVSKNDERAIVLFKPMNSPLPQSPSNFSISVDSNIISGIKNQILCSNRCNAVKSADDEAARQGSETRAPNECLAVVPWFPSQNLPNRGLEAPQTEISELMESEEMDEATMDIEEDNGGGEPGQGLSGINQGLQQWQQHCMIPQLPQITSTPIVWYK